jgi:hypothetical protein
LLTNKNKQDPLGFFAIWTMEKYSMNDEKGFLKYLFGNGQYQK